MDRIYINKFMNDEGKYVYEMELYLSHVGTGYNISPKQQLNYSYPNYQFPIAEGGENSFLAECFENIYKYVDRDGIITE